MKISIIYAQHAPTGAIGYAGQEAMPWHIPEDFKYFKDKTMGKPMVMGYNTFKSLPRLLPGRFHYVLTRSEELHAKAMENGVQFVSSIQQAADLAKKNGHEELMVIGGAEVIKAALPLANIVYRSKVEGECFFDEERSLVYAPQPPALESTHGFEIVSSEKSPLYILNKTSKKPACHSAIHGLTFEVYLKKPVSDTAAV
ncbi:Dihydrofolate reductase [compost metagenome]